MSVEAQKTAPVASMLAGMFLTVLQMFTTRQLCADAEQSKDR